MPGFNRRGPEGEGPMTGRRLGHCGKKANRQQDENEEHGAGHGGRPWGSGQGRCHGGGQGRRMGGWRQGQHEIDEDKTSQQSLEQYASDLEHELQHVKQQLDALSSKKQD